MLFLVKNVACFMGIDVHAGISIPEVGIIHGLMVYISLIEEKQILRLLLRPIFELCFGSWKLFVQ